MMYFVYLTILFFLFFLKNIFYLSRSHRKINLRDNSRKIKNNKLVWCSVTFWNFIDWMPMTRKIYCIALTQFVEIYWYMPIRMLAFDAEIGPKSRSPFNFHHLQTTSQALLIIIIFTGIHPDQTIPPGRVETPLQLERLHNHTGAFRWDPLDYTGSVLRVTQVELNSRLSPRIVRTVWLVRFVRRAWSPNCKPLHNPRRPWGSAEVMETCQSYLDLHKFIACGLGPRS